MQIEKINENQLEVILNLDDLKQNNISIHSFMCNSSASQNLFFNILDFANAEIGFNLKNHEIIVEAFAVLNQNSFVLIFTRIPKTTYLHTSKLKYSSLKFNRSLWIKFDKLDEFCMFCNSFNNNLKMQSSLYLQDDCYFLHISFNNIKNYFKILTMAKEFSKNIFNMNFILAENAEIIIENSAIEMCKKYFV